ncbi:MAG: 5-oxoprolinase subunit PxpB [Bacteroidota bacterium]
MKKEFPEVKVMGERAIIIEFKPVIDEKLLEKILFYKKIIEEYYIKLKVEVINTYNSLLVYYMYDIENVYSEVLPLKGLLDTPNIPKKVSSLLYYIPVCYDLDFGLDLEFLSNQKSCSVAEIINLHTLPVYTVYFIGFLPGFLYLGGLDKKLHISRKEQPRMKVEKGAVGIGENQTGIYPKSSPGGWQIIGKSPVDFFDRNSEPPCEIGAGDKVKFQSITRKEFDEISDKINSGIFQIKKEKYEG